VDTQSKCLAFPSLRKDPRQQRIYNMSREPLGVQTPSGWHQTDTKSVNSPNHYQYDLYCTNRLTHPRWNLISSQASSCWTPPL
jgi:hypothetical protein